MNPSDYIEYVPRVPILRDSPYLTTYSWEKALDYQLIFDLWSSYWPLVFIVGAIYLASIFKIQSYMKDKKPYNVDRYLILWNTGLAIFSIICCWRTAPELVIIMTAENGYRNSMCRRLESSSYPSAFWIVLYGVSKFVELGDTMFIVLRKKKLIFLHWYHHFATLFCAVVMGLDVEPSMVLFIVLNTFVHSLMYSYFALNAAGVRFSRAWPRTLTTLQLIQMGTGYWTILYPVGLRLIKGPTAADCQRNPFILNITFVVGISYIGLFSLFYYNSYMKLKVEKRHKIS